MKTISYSETVKLLDKIIESPNYITHPVGIIGATLSITNALKEYLEKQAGAKSIDNTMLMSVSDYFDQDGNLDSNISSREQLLADGSKYNALKYVQSRINEFNKGEYRLLYNRPGVYIPKWCAACHYIAEKVSKPLVILLDFVNTPGEFLDFEFVKCGED